MPADLFIFFVCIYLFSYFLKGRGGRNWRLSTVIWLLFTRRTNSMAPSLSLLFERGPCVQLSACTEAPINLQHVYSVLPQSERRKLDEGDGTVRTHPSMIQLKWCVWKRSFGVQLYSDRFRFDPVWCKLGHKVQTGRWWGIKITTGQILGCKLPLGGGCNRPKKTFECRGGEN